MRARVRKWRYPACTPGGSIRRSDAADLRNARVAKRYTAGSAIPLMPLAKPHIIPHPQNGQAWLSDQVVAALRHISAETLISGRKLVVNFALMYGLFFREVPPDCFLMSRETISLGYQRLHQRDVLDLADMFATVLRNISRPECTLSLMTHPVEAGNGTGISNLLRTSL
jgi:hypothetical protein